MRPPTDYAALRGKRLFLGSPLYGNLLHFGFHQSICNLMLLCQQRGVHLGQKYVGCDSLVPRARNRLVAHFLKTTDTDFLFIDADITFDPEDVLSLLARPEPIVAGVYPRKQLDWTRIRAAARAGVPADQLPYYGFIPVMNWPKSGDFSLDDVMRDLRHVGTGFLRIKREVFSTIITKMGDSIAFDYHADEPVFKGDIGYDFFPVGIDVRYPLGSGARQYLSEDWGFCEMARTCGFSICAGPWIQLIHSGYMDYCGSLDVMDAGIEEALHADAT